MQKLPIEEKIHFIRGQRILLDKDIAKLYGVPTKSINLAVKRNLIRFPPDFMFRLHPNEAETLRFHYETSRWGGPRYLPYAFTEQGVAMLSSVLRSERAALVNIAIMRAFIKLRHALGMRKDIHQKVERLEGRVDLVETEVGFISKDIHKLKNPQEITGPRVKGFGKD